MKNYTITVNGNVYDVTVEEGTGSAAPAAAPKVAPAAPKAAPAAPKAAAPAGAAGSVTVAAPMPGKILGVKANPGQAVKKGDVIVIPQAGTIASINVATGDSVEAGATLATLN